MFRYNPQKSLYGERPLSIAMIGTRGLPASYGGVEMAVEALAQELVKRGHQVTVYGRSAYCDPQLRKLDGIDHISLTQINTKHLEAISHTALSTAHALASRRFDIIHFHATGPAMLSLITRTLRVPTVATAHGLDWRREKWGLVARQVLRVAARVTATVPHGTIAVSQELTRRLNTQYGRTTTYIPNGVTLAGLDEQSPVSGLQAGRFILFLGRIVPEKQVHVLIRAFSKVESNFRLAIVGPASHSGEYMHEIQKLALADARVLILGPRYGTEKAWLFRNAALFVQPSTLEGLPIALLEALALDQFTIVSDIPENTEVVTLSDNKPYGLTFRAGDIDDLTDKLTLALSQDSHLLKSSARIGQLIQERYSWERVAEETELVYRQALSGHT